MDFAGESITTTATQLQAGASIPATVRVRNVGGNFVSLPSFAAWQLVLSFDAPYEAGGNNVGSRGLPSLQSGESTSQTITVTVPPGFSPDQVHRLYARVYQTANPTADVSNANDQATLDFGGMPMPFGLNSSAVPGTQLVQLTWDAIADPDDLIAGYRVWYHDGDGEWRHLGSSFAAGFIDLAAPLGVERHYRVTSYSRNALESPPSNESVATATPRNDLFMNGFE